MEGRKGTSAIPPGVPAQADARAQKGANRGTPISTELASIEDSISELRGAISNLRDSLFLVLQVGPPQSNDNLSTAGPPKAKSGVPMADRLQFIDEGIKEAIFDITDIKEGLAI